MEWSSARSSKQPTELRPLLVDRAWRMHESDTDERCLPFAWSEKPDDRRTAMTAARQRPRHDPVDRIKTGRRISRTRESSPEPAKRHDHRGWRRKLPLRRPARPPGRTSPTLFFTTVRPTLPKPTWAIIVAYASQNTHIQYEYNILMLVGKRKIDHGIYLEQT
jgi:hypothetical protein